MSRTSSAFVALFVLAFLLTGCGGGTAISTGPTGAPVITVSATPLTFPMTTVGQTSAPITVTIANSGSASATISGVLLTGNPTPISFSQTAASTCSGTSFSIAAGGSCTLAIVFTPTAASTATVLITVVDNSGNIPNSSQNVTLTGTGTTSNIPQATLSASTIAFASTPVGTSTASQSVMLTNGGTGALSIASIVYGGVNIDQFSTSNNCGSTLTAGAFCTINATFSPTQIGTFSATVTFTDNANGVTGSTQVLTFTGTSTGPVVTLGKNSIVFTGTPINTSATAQSVSLTNNGSGALNLTSVSITGTNAALFSITANTCGSTVAAGANCSISVNFTPTAAGIFTANLSIADNATGSPQLVSLTGTGQTAAAPIATLSGNTLTFPSTLSGSTSAAMSVMLTNTGSTTLNIASITLGGTNPSSFTQTTTCGSTLASGANCSISATFTPPAVATYTATVTITDNNNNVAGSTQTVTLNGAGSSSTTYHTLYVFPESDNSATPLYALVNAATKTIDMTMYALQDLTFTNDLIAACKRGVVVRVILDQNNEKSNDTPDFNLLNAQAGCTAVWANKAFAVTHEKSIMIDGTIDVVLSLNLQSQYYSTTRDYAIVDNDTNDYAADEATFNMDFAAGTTASGTVGASDLSYQPGPGTDLVWSPTTAQANMLAIINNATKTLYIENEEFSATVIVNAVAAAAQRGVAVVFVGENQSNSYTSQYSTIKAAGASVYYYSSSTGFYVHGKTVVADQGLSTEAVYMGSINYSNASLNSNRELGIYVTGNTAVSNPIASTIKATILSDESQTGVTHY